MKVGVVRFPGSNCDDDARRVVRDLLEPKGVTGELLWHKDATLPAVDAVILPGGFSYGDYLRCGAMAAHAPIMGAIKAFAAQGGPVLGICNGFQIACEAGLLEGVLLGNSTLKFECRDVHLRVEGKPTPFTKRIPAGRILKMGIAHHDGRYVHDDPERLEREGRVIFRYVAADGGTSDGANPNGSVSHIAGVANAAGNVVGLMPHPERATEALLGSGSTDGLSLFESLLSHFRDSQETRT